MQLDHFNIAAPMDLLKAVRDFYVDVLGFEEGFRPAFSRRGYWLYADDAPAIHLIESERHRPGQQGFLDHIAFRTRGLDKIVRRLESHAIAFRRSTIPELGMTQLFFSDPVGTGLELNFRDED
ncbi:MAG: VOC family protein [Xanthomonadales bacterium]|nr:VOC family protein [Xanthomonadales bacterium]